MKVVTVVGARPQFVKAAVVSRALAARPDIQEVIVHTGQHFDANMSDVFFKQMELPKPDYQLGVGGGTHGSMTGRQLEKIEQVLMKERPDWVLVFGDTNSTLAGAIAASKLNIPIAHVEAGLRSFNRRMPEEINRVLTDHVSKLLFAPSESAKTNLRREGLHGDSIKVVGDVMLEATRYYLSRATMPAWFEQLSLGTRDFVLCTVHRAENTEDVTRLERIVTGLELSEEQVILPLHPRTRAALMGAGIELPSNIHAVGPVGYLEMNWLEANCRVIATDSGGVQKEAYFHGKPCVTLRDETEWVELVDAGCNVLAGADSNKIAEYIRNFPTGYGFGSDLYGDGATASRIAEALL